MKNNTKKQSFSVSRTNLFKIIIIITLFLGFGVYFVFNFQSAKDFGSGNSQISGDAQTIEVTAKSGGYAPSVINAKAGVPTILKMTSDGSVGCQNGFKISELNVSKTLSKGTISEINIPSQKSGKKMVGLCTMGMYQIAINFN